MKEHLKEIPNRIRTEINEIHRLLIKIEKGWGKAKEFDDDLYVDSVALNLHGFYSGFERIFELIATEIDGKLPKGENWHKLLLVQMTRELSLIRPAIISIDVLERLDDFRGFRHIVRNVYTFMFDMAKMEKLIRDAPIVFEQLKKELLAFANFIDESINKKNI